MAELMASNFVHNAIDEDLKEGKYTEGIHTRFPPEPNGYLLPSSPYYIVW